MTRVHYYANLPAVLLQCLTLLKIHIPYSFPVLKSLLYISSDPSKANTIVALLAALLFTRFVRGWSVVTIPHILCSVFTIILVLVNYHSRILCALSFLTWVIHAAFVAFYHHYDFPRPTGRFKAGFLYTKRKNLTFSAFYPTDEIEKPLASLIQEKSALDKYYEVIVCFVGRIPRFLFNILNHYMTKLKIRAHKGAKIISTYNPLFDLPQNKFIPIIFSHSIGAHANAFSSLCVELASHGYIVFCLDHSEDIARIVKDDVPELKREYLEKRVKECRQLLDSLQDEKLLHDIFDEAVPLALDQVIIMGHSYGGAAAYLTCIGDKRIKNCILLDPYTGALKKGELERKVHCNLVILESETWDTQQPHLEVRKRNKLIAQSQCNNGKITLYSVVGRTDHVSFMDNALFGGPMLLFTKQITYFSEVEETLELISLLVYKFVRIIAEGQRENKNTDSLVQNYLEEFGKRQTILFERS